MQIKAKVWIKPIENEVDMDKRLLTIIDDSHTIKFSDLSYRIIDRIYYYIDDSIKDEDISMNDNEFQYVIDDTAMAWAIRNNVKELYFQDFNVYTGNHEPRWTPNLRDALIFNDRDKASRVLSAVKGEENTRNAYAVVPLIYQLDPFYDHNI